MGAAIAMFFRARVRLVYPTLFPTGYMLRRYLPPTSYSAWVI